MDCLIQNAMRKRFTWEESAKKYENVYNLAIQRRQGKKPVN